MGRRNVFVSFLVVFTGMVCLSCGLIGCASPVSADSSHQRIFIETSDDPINCVLIYGERTNSAAQILSDDKALPAEEFIWQTANTGGEVDIVRLDGDPESVGAGWEMVSEEKNAKWRESELQKKANEVFQILESDDMKAKTPEVDIVDALDQASRILATNREEGRENVVVIVDSGVSTKGLINFAQNGLRTKDPQDFVAYAQSQGLLPDLSGIDKVVWCCFGSVTGSQEELTPGICSNMKELYITVIKAAAGEDADVSFEDVPGNCEPSGDLPAVTAVKVPEVSPYAGADPIVLREDDSGIQFKPDTADFIDPGAARSALSDYALELKGYPNLRVTITGYTAHYSTPESCQTLAQRRADAVRQVLIDQGVAESQATAIGGGWGPYGDDQQNRCVVLQFQ